MSEAVRTAAEHTTASPLLAEGLNLFFPATACHAVLMPLAWIVLFAFALPFARDIPASQWHAHEMIFGTYSAALAGFLTSAVAEWTDTPPRHGRALLMLLLLWLPGRIVGLLGWDGMVIVAAATDLAFLGLLFWYVVRALIARGSARHSSFAVWVAALWLLELCVRLAWLSGNMELAGRLLHAALMVFLVFFSLAIARINVVVINLALDPSAATTPYRPHPGRQNLAAGLIALYAATELLLPASAVPAYLALAAAAALFDRLAEWFVGSAILQTHVLTLAGANLFGGAGLMIIGLAELGVPLSSTTGLHMVSVAALGLAVLGVFIIAGLRHSGRPLELPWYAHAAVLLVFAAGLVRVLPETGMVTSLSGRHYGLSAFLWSLAFLVWLAGFLPLLRHPIREAGHCQPGSIPRSSVSSDRHPEK